MPERDDLRVGRLILVPAIITLAVTLARLAGELMGGSDSLFSRDAGGKAALALAVRRGVTPVPAP